MQSASIEYKAMMESELRGRSFVYIYLGVINRNAQQSAYTDSDYTDFSDTSQLFGNPTFEAYYVTAEEDFAKVDGSQYFLPDDANMYALYQGAVTEEIKGNAEFHFGYINLDIKGLTIDFKEYYPIDFDIVSDTKTVEIRGNTQKQFVTDEVFNDTNFIRIEPITMVGGQQRLRIFSILFGVGLIFTNDNLESTSRVETRSPINAELPTIDFTFTVNNRNLLFNKDNPNSFANFLEEKQPCESEYGRELEDGSIYRINGAKTLLKAWSSNDTIARFTTTCRMAYMDGTFYKGKYYASGISLYALALLVLADGEIDNYYIDPYLQNIFTKNPLPETTHKACLQIIANAGRCTLYEDRNGKLSMVSSFMPDIISIEATQENEYSNVSNIVNSTEVINYVDCEENYVKADATQYFVADGETFLQCGYVSDSLSDANGLFTSNPTVTVQFESQFKSFGLTLAFGGVVPQEIIIHQYNDDVLIADMTIEDLTSTTYISEEFETLDKFVFEFTKADPFNRIRLNKIDFGDATDYTMTYGDLSATPIATDIEKVSGIDTSVYDYDYGTEIKKLATATVSIGINTFKIKSASHGYTISATSGTVAIVDSGAYFITITSTEATEVVINGYEFIVTETVHSKIIQETGTVKKSTNPLIGTSALAIDVSDWLADYFSNDIEYNLTYRGEPRIDASDLIYLENKFVDENLIQICSNQIDTSSGMSPSCKINARRISYVART